ncbi:MAG: lysophospholipid acyltransferase family protein [Candidatus Sumerlaeaceae bacterium]|nr:lysophospholipid acyltransferase family protein [Candidatus Sumerlaeaceae bacterium]
MKLFKPQDGLTQLLAQICRHLPPWMLWPLSRVVGILAYVFERGQRRRVEKNFRVLMRATGGTKSPAVLTREYFRRQLMEVVVGYVLQNAPERSWDRLVERHGFERIGELLKQGRGLVLCCVHFGTHVVTANLLAHEGYCPVIIRPASMRDITSQVLRELLLIHHETIYVGSRGSGLATPLRAAIQAIRQGKVLGIAIDGDIGDDPVYLPFLGGKIPVHRGAIALAHRACAPVGFGVAAIERGRVVVTYGPFMEPGPDGYTEEQMDHFLRACVARYEQAVRDHPESVWWSRPLCEALGLADTSADRRDAYL